MRWTACGRGRYAVAAAAAFVACVGLAAPAQAAQRGDAISASIPPGSHVSAEGQGRFYLLTAHPGDVVTQTVLVTNTNDHAVTVAVEAVDAKTGDATGVAFMTPGSPKAITSRWLVVSSPEITLQPQQQRAIPFTVYVPRDAKPGQYLAGVSASVPLKPDTTPKKALGASGAGFSMSIRFQRAIAVEIDVAGMRAPQLVVSGAEPVADANGVMLGVHIANQGNAFAHGNGVIRVADTKTDVTFKIDTFVSRTAILYTTKWTPTVVPGSHHVQVDLNYEDGRRTSWNGDIVIAGDEQNRLENALRNLHIGSRGSGPNLLIVLAVILGVFFVAGAVVLRRRSRGPGYVKYRAA